METKKVEKRLEEVTFDIQLSMKDNKLTLVIYHQNRTHRIPISIKNAQDLSNKLTKGASFLEKSDVS